MFDRRKTGDVSRAGAQETPALEIDGLKVGYRRGFWRRETTPAVAGIRITVMPGEVVGFLGPNGAGKSSTIKAIMGFVAPDAGRVRVFGHPAGTVAAKSKIGYLPEVAMYYPFLTAVEIMRLYGRLQGLGGQSLEREIMELLARVGLSGSEKRQLKTYSKGMQQRLGIAQALLGSPDLLVLDEVSSGLDPVGRRHLREILADVRARGATIFFSSHELSEVAMLCDRIVMIHKGVVVDERAMTTDLRAGVSNSLEDLFIRTIEDVPSFARETARDAVGVR